MLPDLFDLPRLARGRAASPWTEERLRHLRRRWKDGARAREIGAELGVSANAVIAKIHRIGIARLSPTSRRLVMYNDFVIIGPEADPAKIKGLRAAAALRRIAETKTPFVSRGDQSGTHVRELAMWKRAGIDPKGQSWYRETGQGQGLTMDVASQFQAYAFTDRGTYLVHARRIGLPILVEDDPALYNIYHVMPVNAAKFPKVNASAGQAFADWVVSPEGQAVIAEVGKGEYGRSLFVPAATKHEDELLQN